MIATPTDREKGLFYSSTAWRKLRAYKLSVNPFCECEVCRDNGLDTPADEVHHIIDIEDAWDKRLDLGNLMSVSHQCHSRMTIDKLNRRLRMDRRKAGDKVLERLTRVVGRK